MKRFCFSLFLFLVSIFTFLSSGVIDTQDGFQYVAVARNLYYTGEPTAPPYEYTGGVWVGKNIHMSTDVGRDGKSYSATGIGYSLAFLPAVFLTDLVYKYYHVTPPVHFPLESDWLILMLASFTNGFFAAILGVIIFLYFLELNISKKNAVILVFITLFATNLLAYSKHVYAHMMFISFLVLAFYFLKIFVKTGKYKYILLSGFAYGLNLITYNLTSVLGFIPFVVYYLLLTKPRINLPTVKKIAKISLLFLITFTPFLFIFYQHQQTIAPNPYHYVSAKFYEDYAKSAIFNLPISMLYEGIYGQLFSPGRSIFLYTPLLSFIFLFWHKINKKILPEFIMLMILSFLYLSFYGVFRLYEAKWGFIGYWHGELSWGPRYLTPLIPFAMLVIGYLYQGLVKKMKIFVFYPLVVMGFLISLVGIMLPFQIKLHGMDQDIYISGQHYTSFLYINLLPKFSPIITHPKKLEYTLKLFPKTLDHGIYNVKFYDGFDFPFSVGTDRWRTIEGLGILSFDDNRNEPINRISMEIINHPMTKNASSSARLLFSLNDKTVNASPELLQLGEKKIIELDLKNTSLIKKDNILRVYTSFSQLDAYDAKNQLAAMTNLFIDGKPVNIESLDFPYLSDFGPAITGIKYENYGGINSNPWKSWMVHTQIFERVPDFWWIKALYYWDFPKRAFFIGFLFNLSLIILFGILTFKSFRNLGPEVKLKPGKNL